MNNKDKQRAHEYFLNEYGEQYTNRGHLMSFGYSTLPRLIRYSKDISSDAKICYETLTDMIMNTEATNPWLFFPSQKRIALLSGMRRETANKALRELWKANLIGVKRQGQGKQNIYCILAPPAIFIDEALRVRAILNLIQRDEISWDEITDDGFVKKEGVIAKITAEKSVVAFDVTNNAHQEVIEKKCNDVNDSLNGLDNSQSHQEVISENPPAPIPPQGATSISKTQELSSVEVTSNDITSVTTNPPIREKDAQIGKSDGGDFLDGVQNNSDSGNGDTDNSIHSETDKIGGKVNDSNRVDTNGNDRSSCERGERDTGNNGNINGGNGNLPDDTQMDKVKQGGELDGAINSSDSNFSSDNHLVPDGEIDERLTYIQGVVDYFNWLYIKYNDKISQRTTRPAKLQSVDKYAKGKYRAALGWYNQGIPLDRICEVLDVWVGAHTDSPVPLNYFANHEVPVELTEIDPEALAYVKEYFKEE